MSNERFSQTRYSIPAKNPARKLELIDGREHSTRATACSLVDDGPGTIERGDLLSGEDIVHIFVVDDEKAISETLAIILRKSGFRVTSFTNPLEALEKALTGSPCLLLSDVFMPELSGIDLAVQIKEKCPNCKILLFSGQAETNDLLGAAREQGHDFSLVAKPVHPVDLLERIRDLI
jgi:CheY-like chemotaxis protein